MILALTEDPQSTRAWGIGAVGESALGAMLDGLRTDGLAVIHDRRIPGSRANIDHIVVSPAGVFVIDAKRYSGKVEVRSVGSLFRPDTRLCVGGRDRTSVVRGMSSQVAAVERALDGFSDLRTPIHSVVCFVDSEWGLFARPINYGGVQVTWPGALAKAITSGGEFPADAVPRAERVLALALPSA